MKYEIKLSKTCKKNLKKLSTKQKLHFLSVIEKLANNEKLEKIPRSRFKGRFSRI